MRTIKNNPPGVTLVEALDKIMIVIVLDDGPTEVLTDVLGRSLVEVLGDMLTDVLVDGPTEVLTDALGEALVETLVEVPGDMLSDVDGPTEVLTDVLGETL